MTRSFRLILAATTFAASAVAPATLRAQASATKQNDSPDSLAFPRQFVKWVMNAEGDSAFSHAAPALREGMKSAEDVKAMPARMATRFGEPKGTDAEIQFSEGALNVYMVVMRYSLAPQPGVWIVAYSPTTKVVERSSFTSLASAKKNYPQAKLP